MIGTPSTGARSSGRADDVPRGRARRGRGVRSWSGGVRFTPREVLTPSTEDELAHGLAQAAAAGRTVRPIGAGHSFTPLARTEDVLLRLDALNGLISADPATNEVWLWGGTRLRDVGPLLAPWGLALECMGDIDAQSIAGAISTSTHGTGLGFTGYSGTVTGLRLALPDGRLVDVDAAHDPELFAAARVGLGVMGVITRVRVRCVPAFTLALTETTEPIDHVLRSWPDRLRAADHLEFFWFPGTARATVRQQTRLAPDAPLRPLSTARRLIDAELLGNGAFGLLGAAASAVPALAPAVREVASRAMAGADVTDRSHRVFVAPRRVRFEETEYALPLETFAEVVPAVERAIRRAGVQVTFPLEVRATRGDDTWLGTPTGRDTLYVAAHRSARDDPAELLAAVEPVLLAHGGRPHWGKRHTCTAEQLAAMYLRFSDHARVRRRIDPDGVLMTPYLRRLLAGE